jgi:hypothetical protein
MVVWRRILLLLANVPAGFALVLLANDPNRPLGSVLALLGVAVALCLVVLLWPRHRAQPPQADPDPS